MKDNKELAQAFETVLSLAIANSGEAGEDMVTYAEQQKAIKAVRGFSSQFKAHVMANVMANEDIWYDAPSEEDLPKAVQIDRLQTLIGSMSVPSYNVGIIADPDGDGAENGDYLLKSGHTAWIRLQDSGYLIHIAGGIQKHRYMEQVNPNDEEDVIQLITFQ